MDDDVVVLEAARAIRPYLDELVGAGARKVDDELADLLAAAGRGEKVGERVLDVLGMHPATHGWVAGFLVSGLPPDAVKASERYAGLPGHGEVTRAHRFVCPEGDFSWYRARVGLLPPKCPTHDLELIRGDRPEATC